EGFLGLGLLLHTANQLQRMGKKRETKELALSFGLGLWLLSQVEPSEIFLKSISNEVTSVEVIYPS
ncbi:hypothetical protein S245_058881, partial [Arachis hypogaea]